MSIIGLTGGIASGKSTVAKRLRTHGAQVIDADRLGHRAYAPGTTSFAQVITAFGNEVVAKDGAIDRRRLGAKVFSQPTELKKLTDIVWPEIRRLAGLEIEAARAADPNALVILEAAVMVEAGWQDALDEMWAVIVAPELAIERAMARDGLSAKEVQNRLDAQVSNAERKAHADILIDNNGSLAHLYNQVDALCHRLNQTK